MALRLALAHHPLCSWFHADTHAIVGVRVCSGCAWAFPGMLAGLVAALSLGLHWEPVALAGAGLTLGLPQLTTYVYRGNPAYRHFAKAIGGVGLGGLTAALPWIPLDLAWKIGGGLVLGLVFVGLQLLRVRSMLATCRKCPWAMNWEVCPGFNRAQLPSARF